MIGLLLFSFAYIALGKAPERQYVIEEDFFQGFKAREFSVYNRTDRTLLYRIESSVSFSQSIKLVTFPSKTVIGKAYSSKYGRTYKGELKLRDLQNKKWSKVAIKQNYQLLGQDWSILWNNTELSMATEPASLETLFYDNDEINRNCLAKFRKRAQSLVWYNKYIMEVYSNVIPDSIYLLSLAVQDYANQWRSIG